MIIPSAVTSISHVVTVYMVGWLATWLLNNSFILMGQAGPCDLQRGKVRDCRRVDRPHTVTIVSKCHQLRGQTEIAANYGSISSWDYCLVNECSLFFPMSQPWCVRLSSALSFPRVFIDWASLPVRSARTHLPSIDITSNGYPVCVLGWIVCVQSTWPLSLLFSLKSCSVAEQKATSRSPPLRVGIVVYLYLRVRVAVVEAAAAPCSPAAFQFAVTSCSFT